MSIRKLVHFISSLLLFLHHCFAYGIISHPIEQNEPIKFTIKLVKQCYPNIKASFLITDLSSDSFQRDYYTNMIGSVVAFDDSAHFERKRKLPYPCAVMVLSSATKVTQIFEHAKWRNHNQFFIILDGENTNNGCVNAQLFLMEAWKNDIFNVIFICLDHENKIPKIYSFNPFASSAPMSWMKISVIPAINNHSWTLFSWKYNFKKPGCKDLFFKKTSNLAGYPVKSGLYPILPYVSYKVVNGTYIFGGYDYILLELALASLNTTLDVTEFATSPGPSNNVSNEGLIGKVASKQLDLLVNSCLLREILSRAEIMYPFRATGISVITQKQNYNRFGSELFVFLPLSIAVLFFITSALIFILLRFGFKDPYFKNSIDILRVYLNLPLPKLPMTTRSRIIFGATLLGFTIANIVIQANMNTALASENTARNVENLQDLTEMGYTVVTYGRFVPWFISHNISNVKIISEEMNCSLLKEHEAFASRNSVLKLMMTENCHMPKNALITGIYLTYYTRKSWPLYSAVNEKLMMLFNGGLTYHLFHKIVSSYLRLVPQEIDGYEAMTFDHLEYVFYAFIFGIVTSVIVFGIELYIARLSRKLDRIFNFIN